MVTRKTSMDDAEVADFTGPHPVFETGREDLPEDLKSKYDVVLASLQGDARGKLGFGFLEQMMCERLAVLHCIGLERARRGIGQPNPAAEGDGEPGFVDLKDYSDFQKMWFDLASKLQRAQAMTVAANQTAQRERDRLTDAFTTLIESVLETDEVDIPAADRKKMRDIAATGVDIIYSGGHV